MHTDRLSLFINILKTLEPTQRLLWREAIGGGKHSSPSNIAIELTLYNLPIYDDFRGYKCFQTATDRSAETGYVFSTKCTDFDFAGILCLLDDCELASCGNIFISTVIYMSLMNSCSSQLVRSVGGSMIVYLIYRLPFSPIH